MEPGNLKWVRGTGNAGCSGERGRDMEENKGGGRPFGRYLRLMSESVGIKQNWIPG